MTNIIETRTAETIESEASWEMEDRFFRPLTPEAIARQLSEMQARWFNPDDREFDLEDQYENWMLSILIDAIQSGGLKLK